jgi:transposase
VVQVGSRSTRYSEEFKADAVRLVGSGRSIPQVARELGVSIEGLRGWVKADEKQRQPGALSDVERDELRRLRRENAELQEVNTILKKAAAFFAKENLK